MKKYKSAKITGIIFAVLIFSLVVNILYLGATGKHLISKENIASFAKNRSKKEVVEYAQRGQIYTSDHEKVAVNVKKYKIILVLSSQRTGYGKNLAYVKDVNKTASQLGPILGIDVNELTSKLQTAKDEGRYQIELGTKGNNLSASVKKQIEDCNLTGIEFVESNSRYYPLGDFCSYVVGYAKSYNDQSVKKMVGEMGLELSYDKQLKGKNGYKVYQTDANGYALVDGTLREKDPTNGNDLYLTIDSGLQRNLDYLMSNAYSESGAEVVTAGVMEIKTGKILAMSTYPSFNPNERNISTFNNYFLEGTIECGSVFKPFIYADSIEEGKYDHNAYYNSGSYNVYYGNKLVATIKDHNGGQGWGTITYDQGLYIVDKVVNPETNKVVYQATPKYSKQIFSTNTISQVKDLMLGVIEDEQGTGKIYRLDNDVRMIGKTGTGQVVENGGYSTTLYMHSFVGIAPYDDPQVVMFLTFKSGDSYAQYMPNIVKQTMNEALQVVNRYNAKNTTAVDQSCTLDSYTNQSVNYVKSKLESKSLSVQIIGNGSSVIEQYPLAKSKVTSGDKVFIKTEGKDITLPNLIGWSKKEVQTYASLAGIQLTIDGTSGHVTAQSVGENTVVHSGDSLTVAIS